MCSSRGPGGVLDGHVPSAEVDHARPVSEVPAVQLRFHATLPAAQKRERAIVPFSSVMCLRDCSRTGLRLPGDCPFGGRVTALLVAHTRHFPECRHNAILLPESFSGPLPVPLFAPSATPSGAYWRSHVVRDAPLGVLSRVDLPANCAGVCHGNRGLVKSTAGAAGSHGIGAPLATIRKARTMHRGGRAIARQAPAGISLSSGGSRQDTRRAHDPVGPQEPGAQAGARP